MRWLTRTQVIARICGEEWPFAVPEELSKTALISYIGHPHPLDDYNGRPIFRVRSPVSSIDMDADVLEEDVLRWLAWDAARRLNHVARNP